jgi:hypothetical protein
MTIAVVGSPLLLVAEHFVGLIDLFEAAFGVGLLVHVGVIFAGQLAISFFDLIGAGCPAYA